MSLIALGANVEGPWGTPEQTLQTCLARLADEGFDGIRVSPAYRTKAHGSVRQPDYLNAVAQVASCRSPRESINLFKRLEREAGRRLLGRNAPRPLDIDLLDCAGRVVNWPPARPRPQVVLPHPLLDRRAFVLAPLADLVPYWRHPVCGLTARQLFERLGGMRQAARRREIFRVDPIRITCDS
ncbi:MAG: 2-amino-4-hydroxy-6-hydroxymethyldihydropteridine diphosphokinase [Hyphomicrobiaceae bacterium]